MKPKIIGLSQLKKRLQSHKKQTEREVDRLLEINGRRIQLKARQRVGKDLGGLGQSINVAFPKHKAEISANVFYAFYREFGTGSKVEVPKGYEALAQQGRKLGKRGNWKQFIEEIKAWCRRKGIDEKFAYPIALKIYRVGSEPKPFLIPSYEEGKVQYMKDLKKYLDEVRW